MCPRSHALYRCGFRKEAKVERQDRCKDWPMCGKVSIMAIFIDDYCDQENCDKCLYRLKLEFSIKVDKAIKEVRQHRWALEQELTDLQKDLEYIDKSTSLKKDSPRFDETSFFIRQRIRLDKEIPLSEKRLEICSRDGQTLMQMRETGGERKTDIIKYNLSVIEGIRISHAS